MTNLAQAVDQFANVLRGAPDAALERPWGWGPYEDEGVRFAHFRTFEELRGLEVKVGAARIAESHAPTAAQVILAQYHRAWRELHAVLQWLNDTDAERAPAPGEWAIRQVLAHMAGAEIGFYVSVRYALERHRSNDGRPAKPSDEAWDALSGLLETEANSILEGPYPGLLAFNRMWHAKVLSALVDTTDAELDLPAWFWEDRPFSLRFRLHRFESHLRQHSIQVDKTLVGIGNAPTEVQRLHQLIYGALGDVEGALIGAGDVAAVECEEVAQAIVTRAVEIQAALPGM